MVVSKILKFVDLFAGLGGFHLAMKSLGHKCVFASEIDDDLSHLYELNFQIAPYGDIRRLEPSRIPEHDVLCAGFPCQPFSKAGEQRGLECPDSGDLIDYIVKTLRSRKPEFLILENVPNLTRHNNGETWRSIRHRLRLAGYSVDAKLLSPHQFGVPQIRPRVFIVGRRGGLGGFTWPEPISSPYLSIRDVLDDHPHEAKRLPKRFVRYLQAWQQFLSRFPKNESLPSFPIWAMEFGATYPYKRETPRQAGWHQVRNCRGAFGYSLQDLQAHEVLGALPAYAQDDLSCFPKWKVDFIEQNRELYARHRKWIDEWLPRVRVFPPSFQKLEWNCKGEVRNIWRHVIQFRASGIRIKRATTAPSLVAMTTSQVPVIGWERRYMTVRECSRLQSLDELRHLPTSQSQAFKSLGNAVNVKVVHRIAERLLQLEQHEYVVGSRIRQQRAKQTPV